VVVKEEKNIRGRKVEYKERIIEEGILDIYLRFCQKLKIPPIIGAMNFIFLIILILSIILVFSNKDWHSIVIFGMVLIIFTLVNLYAYKKEKECEKK